MNKNYKMDFEMIDFKTKYREKDKDTKYSETKQRDSIRPFSSSYDRIMESCEWKSYVSNYEIYSKTPPFNLKKWVEID